MILKVLENIPTQFSRYEIIDNQLIVSPSDRVRAFTSKKLIRASCRSEKEREEIGQTTMCVITFSKQILFAKIARLRRLHRQLRAVLYGRRIGAGAARRDSGITHNSERLVNRKLKVESEIAFVPGGASKKKGRDKRIKPGRGANLCQAPCLSRLSVEETKEGNANHATITHLTRRLRFNCALTCPTLVLNLSSFSTKF